MLREGLNYSTASGRAGHYWQSKNVCVTTETGALELAVQAKSELTLVRIEYLELTKLSES